MHINQKIRAVHKNESFKLLKDTDNFKKGKTFPNYGGLTFGIVTKVNGEERAISFFDKSWFTIIKHRPSICKNFIPFNY